MKVQLTCFQILPYFLWDNYRKHLYIMNKAMPFILFEQSKKNKNYNIQ